MVSFNDESQLIKYLEKYLLLLGEFYSMNRLKINTNKTALLICPAQKKYKPKLSLFHDSPEPIKNSYSIKILGSVFTPSNTLHSELNATLSACYHRLNILQQMRGLADTSVRTQFANAFVLSRLLFNITSFICLPAYHL